MVAEPGVSVSGRPRRWLSRLRPGAGAGGWAQLNYQWPEPRRAVSAVVCAALATAWAPGTRPSERGVVVTLCVAGFAVVAVAVMVKKVIAVVAGAALIGLGFLLGQVGQSLSVVVPAVVGCLLFSSVELAWWAGQMASRTVWPPEVNRQQWLQLALLVLGGATLAVLIGAAGITGLGAGQALLLLGTAGAVLFALGLVAAARHAVLPTGPGGGEQ